MTKYTPVNHGRDLRSLTPAQATKLAKSEGLDKSDFWRAKYYNLVEQRDGHRRVLCSTGEAFTPQDRENAKARLEDCDRLLAKGIVYIRGGVVCGKTPY